jgi:hypothetical protein
MGFNSAFKGLTRFGKTILTITSFAAVVKYY